MAAISSTQLAITAHILVWSILAAGNTLWTHCLDEVSISCLLYADTGHSPDNTHCHASAPPLSGQDRLKRKYQKTHNSHHPMSCRSLNTSSWLRQTPSRRRASPLQKCRYRKIDMLFRKSDVSINRRAAVYKGIKVTCAVGVPGFSLDNECNNTPLLSIAVTRTCSVTDS